jgi:hypothetical protein
LLDNPKKYGTYLGKAIFQDKVRDEFKRALESGNTVRLFVEVEDQELRTLRWERLCAPTDRGWDFLALDQRLLFSLYIPTTIADRRFQLINGPEELRALIVVASPEELEHYSLAPFNAVGAITGVQEALGQIPCDVLANCFDGAIGPPTLEALCSHLTKTPYSVLHIVCHGRMLKNGETVLYWADVDNQVQPIPATRLLNALTRITNIPHFAFLSTCESASPTAETTLGGLGQRLVRELGMHAVVAMTERVTVKTALTLGKQFYQRLRETGEVDLALCEATAGLGGREDVIVPALFSRLGEQSLFTKTAKYVESQAQEASKPLILYLINRNDQERRLAEAIEQHVAADSKRPLLCLMHGDEHEYDKFPERLKYVLPRMLPGISPISPEDILIENGENQVQDITDWQDDMLYSLKTQLLEPKEIMGLSKPATIAAIAQKLAMKSCPVILRTSLYPEDGPRGQKTQLIEEGFIKFWAEWPQPEPAARNPLLLVCLFLKYRVSPRKFQWWPLPWPRSAKQQLETFFSALEQSELSKTFSVNGVVLPRLTGIRKRDVEKWVDRYFDDLNLLRGDKSEIMTEIDDIYAQHPAERISMRELVKQLKEKIWNPQQN